MLYWKDCFLQPKDFIKLTLTLTYSVLAILSIVHDLERNNNNVIIVIIITREILVKFRLHFIMNVP